MYNKHYVNEMINDISADIYNWFNKYCMNLLDHTDYKWVESTLNNLDYTELANEAIIDLSLSDDEDTRLLVEDELEKLTSEFIDYMKFGKDNSFSRSNSDWLDKYSDNDAYTASLENYKRNKMIRRKTNKFESRKLTLEERITRLERQLRNNYSSLKYEGYDDLYDLDTPAGMKYACNYVKKRIDDLLGNGPMERNNCKVEPFRVDNGFSVAYHDGDIFHAPLYYDVYYYDNTLDVGGGHGIRYAFDKKKFDSGDINETRDAHLDAIVEKIVEDINRGLPDADEVDY